MDMEGSKWVENISKLIVRYHTRVCMIINNNFNIFAFLRRVINFSTLFVHAELSFLLSRGYLRRCHLRGLLFLYLCLLKGFLVECFWNRFDVLLGNETWTFSFIFLLSLLSSKELCWGEFIRSLISRRGVIDVNSSLVNLWLKSWSLRSYRKRSLLWRVIATVLVWMVFAHFPEAVGVESFRGLLSPIGWCWPLRAFVAGVRRPYDLLERGVM